MKLNEILYSTPEMSEEKLIKIISKEYTKSLKSDVLYRLRKLHKSLSIENSILKEWDLIQLKTSNLSKSQRDSICSLVSYCLIKMTKDNGRE